MEEEQRLQEKFALLLPYLNERDTRLAVAAEAISLGFGGVTAVHKATKLARSTIATGIYELKEKKIIQGRIRKKGGGRKKIRTRTPKIVDAIELEANPKTDRRTIVKWTSHSLAKILKAVQLRGFHVGEMTIWRTLKDLGYALKANKKDIEGGSNYPDRDAQFQHINMLGLRMQLQGFPILSIDCKKTEKIGNMKSNGKEWMPKGEETNVQVYDFGEKDTQTKKIKKAIPYGIYDILKKQGFVNIGINHNTAEFAVASLIRWWDTSGKQEYAEATELLIFADCGSSNGYKNKLWKYSLQQFANHTGLIVHVCHYPPGTSKWNSIEHELFSFITINWRARPLIGYETVLELIRHTTTKTGLKVAAYLDEREYETGKKVTDDDIKRLNLQKDDFLPDLNYTISPKV